VILKLELGAIDLGSELGAKICGSELRAKIYGSEVLAMSSPHMLPLCTRVTTLEPRFVASRCLTSEPRVLAPTH